EDLVKAQAEFLANLGKLDVEKRELARIQRINSGIVANKVLLERQYEIDKLQAILKAQRHSLLLHGLTKDQVDSIISDRNLIREMQVIVPFLHADSTVHSDNESDQEEGSQRNGGDSMRRDSDPHFHSKRFVISQLNVQPGEAVLTGQPMCVLTDYSELYIEGRAFEQDAEEILEAANAGHRLTAQAEQNEKGSPTGLEDLEILHVANQVERDSRALHFYVTLKNEIVREKQTGNRFYLTWRFKPGQRMQLNVPVEVMNNVIVVPVDAIAHEGPETYIFVENGDHFDRRAVHVKYRDQHRAVIANDGSLFSGETVAMNGAHQLLMAIKNKAGGSEGGHSHHGHMH
ncbi:MAG: HlyD family efflux transporter periplasmic adaptor subunit, partial [Planctomycetaceae bacterium]|nr:HlyD family efflux transporter periplasmic adaptor subunit [Planctomycetaceae bacterium]